MYTEAIWPCMSPTAARYPDASVVSGKARRRAIDGRDCLENPVPLVEVLSPASADFDRGTKFEQYKSIPNSESLVAQDCPHVARRTKRDPETWTETVFDALTASIRLDTAGIDLTMQEVYEGIVCNGLQRVDFRIDTNCRKL